MKVTKSCSSMANLLTILIVSIGLLCLWDGKFIENTLGNLHNGISSFADGYKVVALTNHDDHDNNHTLVSSRQSSNNTTIQDHNNTIQLSLARSHLDPMDIIRPENTQAMRLESSHHRNISRLNLLFHLIHTSGEANFGKRQKRCLESIFYHHPRATVLFHVKNMTDGPVQYLIQAGYDVQLVHYDIVDILQQLKGENIMDPHIFETFISRINAYAKDRKGHWMVNESDLLRMIQLYLVGGIYLDTDTIVVKPLDGLPPNTIGSQDSSGKNLNNAVLMFERKHNFIRSCLTEMLTKYDNRKWGANGPDLVTKVYFSNPALWNDVHTVPRSYFEYFGWRRIGNLCYNETRDEIVWHHLRQISEKSYIVHMNNNMGFVVREGSACDCLQNTFCLSSNCTLMDRCVPLVGKAPIF